MVGWGVGEREGEWLGEDAEKEGEVHRLELSKNIPNVAPIYPKGFYLPSLIPPASYSAF